MDGSDKPPTTIWQGAGATTLEKPSTRKAGTDVPSESQQGEHTYGKLHRERWLCLVSDKSDV